VSIPLSYSLFASVGKVISGSRVPDVRRKKKEYHVGCQTGKINMSWDVMDNFS
jgi:hypothetical protein